MEGGCWPYCTLVSGFGFILLVVFTQAGCGLAVQYDYQFIPIRKESELAETSFIAAGVYLVLCLLSLVLMLRSKRHAQVTVPPTLQPASSIEMTECTSQTAYRQPNPDFTHSSVTSRLLA